MSHYIIYSVPLCQLLYSLTYCHILHNSVIPGLLSYIILSYPLPYHAFVFTCIILRSPLPYPIEQLPTFYMPSDYRSVRLVPVPVKEPEDAPRWVARYNMHYMIIKNGWASISDGVLRRQRRDRRQLTTIICFGHLTVRWWHIVLHHELK